MANNTVYPYGSLLVTLTSAYTRQWNDQGSGASMNVSFWTPVTQNNKLMRPLGSVAVKHYDSLTNNRATLLVGDNGQRAVASPTDYTWIYDDSGTGASLSCTVWRPVAPSGYVALGDVVSSGRGKPSLTDVWCVRSDLVTTGRFLKDQVWCDDGSGGKHACSIWDVMTASNTTYDADKVPFFADTFIANGSAHQQPNSGLARVLLLPVPAQVSPIVPQPPNLTSRVAPASGTALEKDREVKLPFTCLFLPTDRPCLDRIANPFCTVQRWGSWSLSLFDNNTTSSDQDSSTSTTVGVTDTKSEQFQHSAGITIHNSIGVSIGVLSFGGGAELNYQFTYTSSTSRELLKSDTVTRNLKAPASRAAALWVRHFVFRSVRSDGSSIGYDLPFDINVFHHSQYPA